MNEAEFQQLQNLKRWKAEALPELNKIDQMHEMLPDSWKARLGESKADAVIHFLACELGTSY
jgi:hypothetical protein